MGLFSKPKKTVPAVKPAAVHTGGALAVETFNVVGVHYHEKSIKQLQIPAEDWKKSPQQLVSEGKTTKKVFRYTYIDKPVRLVPDTQNPHERNAVKVMIAGAHVGFVPSDQAKHFRAVVETTTIKNLTADIWGGEYKVVSSTGEAVTSSDYVRVRVHIEYTSK